MFGIVVRRRGFRRLFVAHAISRSGDAFNTVALVILVYRLTHSGLGVAGTVAFEIAPVLALGPVAGVVADRFPRQHRTRVDPPCARGRRHGGDPGTGDAIAHQRVLDLRHGVLTRTWRQRLPSGTEMTFRSARFASLADPQLLVLWAEVHTDGAAARFADAGDTLLAEVPVRAGPVELATLTRRAPRRAVRIGAVDRRFGDATSDDPVLGVLARHRRPGSHRSGLSRPRLLGHRRVRPAVLRRHPPPDGPGPARVPPPAPARRPGQGGRSRLRRRPLPVGVGRGLPSQCSGGARASASTWPAAPSPSASTLRRSSPSERTRRPVSDPAAVPHRGGA